MSYKRFLCLLTCFLSLISFVSCHVWNESVDKSDVEVKEMSDEVSSSQYEADETGSIPQSGESKTNLCPVRNSDKTVNGLTFTAQGDGSYLVNGVSEKATNYDLYYSKTLLPDGFVAGKTYRLDFRDTSITGQLRVCIYWLDQEGVSENLLLNAFYSTNFTIPENAKGLLIRLRVLAANVVIDNAIVKPIITAVEEKISVPGPMFTIIDDDGCYRYYSDLLPLCIEKGISISTAVVPVQIENRENGTTRFWMSWAEIQECQSNGVEVLSHTYDHASTAVVETRTIDEIRDTYQKARDILEEHGIYTNVLVYSGASGGLAKCRSAAGDVYDYAFLAGGDVDNQYGYMDPYNIWRYKIQYNYDFDAEKMKSLIADLAANKTGWMVWMIHTSDSKWCVEFINALSECIDYASQLGIPIVTASEGASCYSWK